jgi:quinol monooxygenase YgiN
MSNEAGFVVVDIWRARPGKQQELRDALVDAGRQFRAMDGVVSVDYTQLVDDESRYLVIFRYRDAEARNAFVATDALRSTMQRLEALWDVESPIYQGAAGL